jgi:dephospho-CoA kinase
MIVIGFCGLPGSGKSTALEAIKDLGLIITMGDIIRNEAKKRDIPLNSANLGKIAEELRQLGGNEVIAEKTVEIVKNQNSKVIFIDGIRSPDEVYLFRKNWNFPLIAIICKKKLRYKRILNRSRSDDSKGLESIKARDKREINFGVKTVIKLADYHIINNSQIEMLQKQTRNLVLKLINIDT